ncbi:fibrocystin [Perognathus longimembris pacificus]|uniref:fibrocystin n=1 Tax=Perognathus longimembris pacificus TaxID=214514 RepID=UPI00201A0E6E|nr:fibrocystin [Perognathus longimembris pacificus]
MTVWLISLSIEVLFLAAPRPSLRVHPREGSLAGGTWLTIDLDGVQSGVLQPANGSQLEIHLVNVALATLPAVPCDVSLVFWDLPVVICQTRSLPSEGHAGLYALQVRSGGRVVDGPGPESDGNWTFEFSKVQTPLVYQVSPSSGVPGTLIQVYGWIITGKLETFDLDEEYLESPLVLESQGDKWVTPCSLINRQNGSRYLAREEGGLGSVQCRVDGNYIGSQNVSFSVFNRGKSMVDQSAWLVSAKQDLFLFQTHSEILSVFPESGSLGGGTDITITGDFFAAPAWVTVAGVPCDVTRLSPREIACTTRAPGKGARLAAPQAGNRGLLFEVGAAPEGAELTPASPGYRWQIVPHASSPPGFWSQEGRPFRARLSGFFVAPETNNYTFWLQADSRAALHFSRSGEPGDKVRVAFLGVGTADWFDSWEQHGAEGAWQQKAPKVELRGGARYYLEAEHWGTAPSRGLRVGVQLHNTRLTPGAAPTYLHEKHQLRARALRRPEVQMLNVSGLGSFVLAWAEAHSPPLPADATAHQIQAGIEALLAVECRLEPASAGVLLRLGFEQGLEGSSSDGVLTRGTEPFCGRFSLCQPRRLVVTPPAMPRGYRLDRFPHLCVALKGLADAVLRVVVTFAAGPRDAPENVTCAWSPGAAGPERWQFACTDLRDACVRSSRAPRPLAARVPLLVWRLHLLPGAPEPRALCVDEVVIADASLTVSRADLGSAQPRGPLVDSVSVVGSPPVFNVSVWPAGCGVRVPLLTASSVSTQAAEEGSGLPRATAQRLQGPSPPLGGHFSLRLPHTVIRGIPAHTPAPELRRLLGAHAEGGAAAGLAVEERGSCYERAWSLSWPARSGDLPELVGVSHHNLTGANPAVDIRVVYDGGIFLGPIFGDMLATANQKTQVVVEVNDVPARCAGSCSFQYLPAATPRVRSAGYSLEGDTSLLVYVVGSGFPAAARALRVTVNRTDCQVVASNQTHVVCRTGLLPAGAHRVSVRVRPAGLAVGAGGEGLVLSVGPRLEAVGTSRAAEMGGLWAAVRGPSVEGVRLVLRGSQPCTVSTTAGDSQRILCQVPPGGEDGYTVNVTVVRAAHSAVLARAFTYVPSLNPAVESLSRNQSTTAGGEWLVLGVALLEDHTDLEVEVRTGDSVARLRARTARGPEGVLPPGLGGLAVSIGGIGAGPQGVHLHIQYIAGAFPMSPCCGSLLGSLRGGLVHVFGAGLSPGNTSATVCGAPCRVLPNATASAFTCAVLPLAVSLAPLCDLQHGVDACGGAGHTYVRCDLTVTVGTETLPKAWPYFYVCDESLQGLVVPARWTELASLSFSGLFVSPKVERDEILIYNSSCNITMETEAEMECETPNQPITAKITEIRESWGQDTQGGFAFRLCPRWSRAHSWPSSGTPQDGDNVTVERGRWLLLDTNTSLLNLLHIKGGKLIFLGPGPLELRAHSILISDGGELRVGTEDRPFAGAAQITLHGSSRSPPFHPYGVKFLAVRNGTLALHGSLPEVLVTHLGAAARARDTALLLEDAVDWPGGADVAVVSGTGVGGAQPLEEVSTVEAVHGAVLHLRSPLRYSHNFTESWVSGERRVFKAMVVLLSRKISIRGNLTTERREFLASCQEAGASEDDLEHCLYSKSEKRLGSRDLGARVVVQSSPEEPSLVQMRGVQLRDLGQAFRKHTSALTLAGALRGSYVHGCTVRNSFSRGLSMHDTWGLRVDSNVFYKISGHALLVGMPLDIRNLSHDASPGSKRDWAEQGNIITNNVIIGVSGAEGLSSLETLAPAGIYIRSPTNVIEGNRVCAAGYGYFFHLVTRPASQAPLLAFTRNTAHACTRYGLFVYPKFQPPWDPDRGRTLFQNFMVWGSAGGAQISKSSNLHLKNFQVYSCRDFGIDILESDENTLVSNSLLLGHFADERNPCMSAGIKTPKRWELMISNTTFVNFDLSNCVAIRTCSGCSQGQGGFTVTTNQLTFANSPNVAAFPFAHAAVLEDADGSLSGKSGSRVLASVETLPASCSPSAAFSGLVLGSVCGEGVVFHRMSIGLANAPDVSYDLTLIDSRNGTTAVPYVNDTLSHRFGWVALLVDGETYALRFESPRANGSLQYSATLDSFAPGRALLLEHTGLPRSPEVGVRCGRRPGRPLPALPSPGRDQPCDWFFSVRQRRLTYLVSGKGQVRVVLQVTEGVSPTPAASTSEPAGPLRWSHPETWQGVDKGWGGYNGTPPGPGDDVIIPPNRTVLVDIDLPRLRGLYVMGTLEFPVDRSNVLSVACLAILGGELRAGTLENPLGKEHKLLIHLRASEGVSCDRLYGIRVDPGMIGVYGKLQLHSAYPKKSWTQLGADIAPGNERIVVEEALDWHPQDKIVLCPSSYEPHEAEVLTVREVRGRLVRIHERLRHRHVGGAHVMEDGRSIRLAVAVGLLTRNVQIRPDAACRARILVGSFRKSTGEEFSGTLRLRNVEIQDLGSPSGPSIALTNASGGSWVMSSALRQSCGGGLHASGGPGLILKDNVVFGTVGHGIDLEGQAHVLSKNLVVLVTQPAWSTPWVAGIKVNRATEVSLRGNVVAGSERLGFHVGAHGCSPQVLWSDNVAHSSLHGVHLYRERSRDGCITISGFLAFKNFDYGAMVQAENSVALENLILVDNTIGLLAVVYVSSASLSSVRTVQIVVKNSTVVATSSSFDCIQDRTKPRSANSTSPERPPSSPRGGRVGILWPVFTSEPNQWPQEPWHKVRNGQAVAGIVKLQDVTFSNFGRSCHGDDMDVCLLPNAESAGLVHPITAERTRMLKTEDRTKFDFSPLRPRKDLEGVICPESNCENPRKYLFKDLDGRTLGLPPPVSVFPKVEAEWTGSFFNTGVFREERRCTSPWPAQSFICREADRVVLLLTSAEVTWANRKSYPVVSVTNGFVDTFSSAQAGTGCPSSGSVSTFYSILPTRQTTRVCFVDQTPQSLQFLLLGNSNTSKLLLALFYHELQSPNVFLRGGLIPPVVVQSVSSLLEESVGANYFSVMDNLLYVVLQGEEPIEIRTGVSIHVAFTVTGAPPGKGWDVVMLERLVDFLRIHPSQLRFTHKMPGDEGTLRAIADSGAKRKHACPTVSCAGYSRRVGLRRPLGVERRPSRVSPPTTVETVSKVFVTEIGDPLAVRRTGETLSLSSAKLQDLAGQLITAQQTGELEAVLSVTVGALLVTRPEGVTGHGNASSSGPGNVVYVRPWALSVLVQPSDGEVGKELPVQPQLVVLDGQSRRVESLGTPSVPWSISVSLEGTADSVLKGCTQAETQDGYVSFSNLAVLISGSNWHFIFTVTSPAGVNLTARSRPFAVLPAAGKERWAAVLAASLGSAVSWLALSCLLCCWLRKSRHRKTRPEETSGPGRQGSQEETAKDRSMTGGGELVETPVGEPSPPSPLYGVSEAICFTAPSLNLATFPQGRHTPVQEYTASPHSLSCCTAAPVSVPRDPRTPGAPHHRAPRPLDGVSRRTGRRGPAAEEAAAAEAEAEAGRPGAPRAAAVTGTWKAEPARLLRAQLAGRAQLLLRRPDPRQRRQLGPGRSRGNREGSSLGRSQENGAPRAAAPAETTVESEAQPERARGAP